MNDSASDDVTTSPEYQATTKNIQQITVSVTTLTKLVQQLGTSKDSTEVREKIRSCVESTTSLISAESSKVKTLTTLATRARDSKTNNFYNNQQPYYDDDREEDESQSLMEASRRQQLAQIESEREYQNSIIQERDEGIRQIEQSITEINEIFLDLSNLVSEQGVMLNTIEHSLESTVMNTTEGVVQIKKASEHQRSARTKMCWLALILFIVAGVLGVILYFALRKK
eukprot:gene9023-10583_t